MICTVYSEIKGAPFISSEIVAIIDVIFSHVPRSKKTKRYLSVHLVGCRRMRILNRERRGIDRPTDVLSFAMEEGLRIEGKEKDLGDIFLCIPYLEAQAQRFGVPFKEEAIRALIHGALHVLQYDHVNKKDAEKMFLLQEKILWKVQK